MKWKNKSNSKIHKYKLVLHQPLMYDLMHFWYNIYANVFGGSGVLNMIDKGKQLTLIQRIKIEEMLNQRHRKLKSLMN